MRILSQFRATCLLPLGVLAVSLSLPSSGQTDGELRQQYVGKTFVLRNFYQGSKLIYDASGAVAGPASSGDWTMSGFTHITSVRRSGRRLVFQADRVPVGNGGGSFHFRDYFIKNLDKKMVEEDSKVNKLHIEVDFAGRSLDTGSIQAALSRVFLTDNDRLADLVPAYWQRCVRAASSPQSTDPYRSCRFLEEFTMIPGVASPSPQPADDKQAADALPAGRLPRMGNGMTPPRVISQTEPEFSDAARRMRYQGTVVMGLVVSKTGEPQDIRIQTPIGFGLDQKAVESVAGWKFKPATRNGEPVDMPIAIEVNFHLY